MSAAAFPGTHDQPQHVTIRRIVAKIEEISRSSPGSSSQTRKQARSRGIDGIVSEFNLPREIVERAMERFNEGAPLGARNIVERHFTLKGAH